MKQVIIIISIIIVVGGSAAFIASQKKSDNDATKNAVATNEIKIKDYAYTPAVAKVTVGSTVTWTNEDSMAHTIASYDGRIPRSPKINQGQTYSHTFTKTGTFKYYCSIHPNMKGIIVVTN